MALRWLSVTSARIPTVEIESLAEFDTKIAYATTLDHWAFQSIDLRDRAPALAALDVRGAMFLGCALTPQLEDALISRGALVFPPLPHVPFNPYRSCLYSADELYDNLAAGYHKSFDGRAYAWYTANTRTKSLPANLAMSLHDQAIGDALADWLATIDATRLVGVMGGHAARRDSPAYADAAHLGASLAISGYVVATGGGPGAMEAVNLGARLAACPTAIEDALTKLAGEPTYHGHLTEWAALAIEVAASYPQTNQTLGVPTWFYGHEPPNAFATPIAKYFSNALREDILLSRCRGGLIILPGEAGTVQEVFQAATRNYYAAGDDLVTPVVLVGRHHWTETLPVWGLLRSLGDARAMGRHIYLVDTPYEAVAALTATA